MHGVNERVPIRDLNEGTDMIERALLAVGERTEAGTWLSRQYELIHTSRCPRFQQTADELARQF